MTIEHIEHEEESVQVPFDKWGYAGSRGVSRNGKRVLERPLGEGYALLE